MAEYSCCLNNTEVGYSYTSHVCPIPMNMSYDEYEDNWVNPRTIQMIDRKPEGVPWFLQVNYPGPHPNFAILR